MSDATLARQANLRLVRRIMLDGQERSPADLAQIARLSIATCNSILQELAAAGELLSVARQTNAVGRKTRFFRVNPAYGHVMFLLFVRKGAQFTAHISIRRQHSAEECSSDRLTIDSFDPDSFSSLIDRAARQFPDLKGVLIAYPHDVESSFLRDLRSHGSIPIFSLDIANYIAYEHYVRTHVGISTFIVCKDPQHVLVFHSLLGSVVWAIDLPFDEMLAALPGFLRLFAPGTVSARASDEEFARIRAVCPKVAPVQPDGLDHLFPCMAVMWNKIKLQLLE